MNRDEALKLLNGGKEGIAEWNRCREGGEEIPELLDERCRPHIDRAGCVERFAHRSALRQRRDGVRSRRSAGTNRRRRTTRDRRSTSARGTGDRRDRQRQQHGPSTD